MGGFFWVKYNVTSLEYQCVEGEGVVTNQVVYYNNDHKDNGN